MPGLNEQHTASNPSAPVESEAAKKARDENVEGEQEKSEVEKERETEPEDNVSFDVDKVDDLEESKKNEKEED